MKTYFVGEREDAILTEIAIKCKKFEFIEILEKSIARRYGSDRLATFSVELGKYFAQKKNNSDYGEMVSVAIDLWKYVKEHGISDTMVNYLKVETLLS